MASELDLMSAPQIEGDAEIASRSELNDQTSSPCPVCQSPDTVLHRTDVLDLEYFVKPNPPLRIRRCRSCGSEFVAPRPPATQLPSFYPPSYHAYNEDHGRFAQLLVGARARQRAVSYSKMLGGKPGSLFDVGTGDCRHFDELRRFCDLRCAGVEIQADIAEKGRERGYEVITGTLEEADLTGHFGNYDIVSMNHVLEHVIEPRVVLERAHQLLRPGGHLLVQLPTISSWEAKIFGRNWGGYHYPRHLQMVSRGGLSHLLTDVGFDQVQIRTAPHIQSALSLQNALIRVGYRPTMRYGKTPVYSLLLVAVLPYETIAWLADRGGIIDVHARAPE
jgi:SAM-dependent methyltransferase